MKSKVMSSELLVLIGVYIKRKDNVMYKSYGSVEWEKILFVVTVSKIVILLINGSTNETVINATENI